MEKAQIAQAGIQIENGEKVEMNNINVKHGEGQSGIKMKNINGLKMENIKTTEFGSTTTSVNMPGDIEVVGNSPVHTIYIIFLILIILLVIYFISKKKV